MSHNKGLLEFMIITFSFC